MQSTKRCWNLEFVCEGTGVVQRKMTQNQLKTLHTVCLTQHYTNLYSQPLPVVFIYRWQAFTRILRDNPLPASHIFTFEALKLMSYTTQSSKVLFFLHLFAYSLNNLFHESHSGDFLPIIFSITLVEGCVNIYQQPSGSLLPHPADAECQRNWFHPRLKRLHVS